MPCSSVFCARVVFGGRSRWRPALDGVMLISASIGQSARFVYAPFAEDLYTEEKNDAGCCLSAFGINEC
jgi:hypothetical protein